MGPHDLDRDLVIDSLLQATHFGGSGEDLGAAAAVNADRALVYLAGSTRSPTLPGATGVVAQPAPSGDYDAFVAVFDPALGELRCATFPEETPVGEEAGAAFLSLRNHGDGPLAVTGLVLSDREHFAVDTEGGDAPCGSLAPVLQAGALCTVGVLFGPRASGELSAALTLLPDDPDEGEVAVALSGGALHHPPLVVEPARRRGERHPLRARGHHADGSRTWAETSEALWYTAPGPEPPVSRKRVRSKVTVVVAGNRSTP